MIDNLDKLLDDLSEVGGDLAEDGLNARDIAVGVVVLMPDGTEVKCDILDRTVAHYIDIDSDIRKMWLVVQPMSQQEDRKIASAVERA